MNKQSLSKLIEEGGLIITRSSGEELFDFSYKEIVSLFEHYGVIIFRGFDIDADAVADFTAIYTESYARDTMRRTKRFNKDRVRTVDFIAPVAPPAQ